MKVYLAARFTRKVEMNEKARELRALNIDVTSRWLEEPSAPGITLKQAEQELGPSELAHIAKVDIEDILRANVIVLFTVDPLEPTPRGGRHFESGFAYALQLHSCGQSYRLITVGPRENIFHYLPSVQNFETWEEAKNFLEGLRQHEPKDPRQLKFPYSCDLEYVA